MIAMNPYKLKIKYETSLAGLDIIFIFPDVKRYFKYDRPDHWDGTLEDLWGLILSSYCGLPVYIIDDQDGDSLKSGMPSEFNESHYQVYICEDEWCSILNEENKIIYARFIDFKEYTHFEKRVEKVIKDFFKSEGFEV